jgi:hypothetical protein
MNFWVNCDIPGYYSPNLRMDPDLVRLNRLVFKHSVRDWGDERMAADICRRELCENIIDIVLGKARRPSCLPGGLGVEQIYMPIITVLLQQTRQRDAVGALDRR